MGKQDALSLWVRDVRQRKEVKSEMGDQLHPAADFERQKGPELGNRRPLKAGV